MNAPPALGYPPGVSLPPTGALCHCHWPLIAAVLSRCASSWSRLVSHPLSRRDLKIRRPPLFRGFLEMVSLTRVFSTDHQVSPTASNFGSNNPFRNRTLSPSNASATSARPERPRSTNPFLDDNEAVSPQSAPGLSTGATMFSPTEKQDLTGNTRDLFVRARNVSDGRGALSRLTRHRRVFHSNLLPLSPPLLLLLLPPLPPRSLRRLAPSNHMAPELIQSRDRAPTVQSAPIACELPESVRPSDPESHGRKTPSTSLPTLPVCPRQLPWPLVTRLLADLAATPSPP